MPHGKGRSRGSSPLVSRGRRHLHFFYRRRCDFASPRRRCPAPPQACAWFPPPLRRRRPRRRRGRGTCARTTLTATAPSCSTVASGTPRPRFAFCVLSLLPPERSACSQHLPISMHLFSVSVSRPYATAHEPACQRGMRWPIVTPGEARKRQNVVPHRNASPRHSRGRSRMDRAHTRSNAVKRRSVNRIMGGGAAAAIVALMEL